MEQQLVKHPNRLETSLENQGQFVGAKQNKAVCQQGGPGRESETKQIGQ